jgi:hypothetical protein
VDAVGAAVTAVEDAKRWKMVSGAIMEDAKAAARRPGASSDTIQAAVQAGVRHAQACEALQAAEARLKAATERMAFCL